MRELRTLSKWLRLILLPVVLLLALIIPGIAQAGVDDYPDPWRAPTPMDSMFDSWGMYNRECTSFVAWRLHSRNDFEMPFYDDAANWGTRASALGYTVNSTPAVGAVAWSTSPQHVAWVESISGSNVVVEEYNRNYDGNYSERSVAASAFQYIHFKDLSDDSSGGGVSSKFQPFTGDFNGDGLWDIGLRRVSEGTIYIKYGPSFGPQTTYTWAGGSHFQVVTGDFNGDGLWDIGLRRTAEGILYIRYNTGTASFTNQTEYTWAGGSKFQPFTGDFNGDGLWDIGLRRIAEGVLYFRYNNGSGSFTNQTQYTWAGGSHFEVVTGDFNGDELYDVGLRRIAEGIFYIRHNIGSSFTYQISYTWAGGTNFQPFTGDFNGDGLWDIGLRKISTGVFYIKQGPSFGPQTTYTWAAG